MLDIGAVKLAASGEVIRNETFKVFSLQADAGACGRSLPGSRAGRRPDLALRRFRLFGRLRRPDRHGRDAELRHLVPGGGRGGPDAAHCPAHGDRIALDLHRAPGGHGEGCGGQSAVRRLRGPERGHRLHGGNDLPCDQQAYPNHPREPDRAERRHESIGRGLGDGHALTGVLMKKPLATAALLALLFAPPALAQTPVVGNQASAITPAGSVPGSCSYANGDARVVTGTFYLCGPDGHYHSVGGGGGISGLTTGTLPVAASATTIANSSPGITQSGGQTSVNGQTNFLASSTTTTPVFTGTGLNDLTVSGPFL